MKNLVRWSAATAWIGLFVTLACFAVGCVSVKPQRVVKYEPMKPRQPVAPRPSAPVDRVPPRIVVVSPDSSKARGIAITPTDPSMTIRGFVMDNVGVATFSIDSRRVALSNKGEFTCQVSPRLGTNRYTLRATDKQGNRATETVVIEAVRPSPEEIAVTPTSPVKQRKPTQVGRRWAIVIGVGRYGDHRIPQLRYAIRDAREFYGWLTSADGGRHAPDNTKLLIDKDATAANIRDALFEWLKQAQEEDLVTIYFSGHGTPESPERPENLFLVPYDADYDKIASTCFPMWDIETALKRFVKARKVVVIADACHAGGIGSEFADARRAIGIQANKVGQAFQDLSQVGDGVCVITSAGPKQLSRESEKWGGGHGVFTYFLLKALKGEADYNKDKRVTLGELIPYLSEQVRRETNSAQSPEVAGKFDPALTLGR